MCLTLNSLSLPQLVVVDFHGILWTASYPSRWAWDRAILRENLFSKLTMWLIEACGVYSLGNHLTQSNVLSICLLRCCDLLSGLVIVALLSFWCRPIVWALKIGTEGGCPAAVGLEAKSSATLIGETARTSWSQARYLLLFDVEVAHLLLIGWGKCALGYVCTSRAEMTHRAFADSVDIFDRWFP